MICFVLNISFKIGIFEFKFSWRRRSNFETSAKRVYTIRTAMDFIRGKIAKVFALEHFNMEESIAKDERVIIKMPSDAKQPSQVCQPLISSLNSIVFVLFCSSPNSLNNLFNNEYKWLVDVVFGFLLPVGGLLIISVRLWHCVAQLYQRSNQDVHQRRILPVQRI